MNPAVRHALTLIAASTTLFTHTTFADGKIQGKITAAGSQANLEGAIVKIDELNLQTVSSNGGRYSFPSVKPGAYTLSVKYLGVPDVKQTVIVENEDIQTNITLADTEQGMEEIVVIGQVGALGSALNKQRAADNLISVVDADFIGQFPDANVSESLQRIAGVSIERDQGEGRYVRIRGMGPDFNAVTINGVSIPSPDSGRRAIALDVIPNDLLESIEVTKSLTSDQDANSIGGAIEIKSLSAFDREGFATKISVENSYNELVSESSPKIGFTTSNTFDLGADQDNFGVALSASWYKREFGSDNVETGAAWDLENGTPLLEEFEQRDYTIERERLGLGLNFDYHLSASTNLYLRSLYSEYSDTETRLANTVEYADAQAPNELGDIDTATRALKNREETQEIKTISLGGDTDLNYWTFGYNIGWSEATEYEPRHIDDSAFEYTGTTLTDAGFTNTKEPRLIVGEDFYNPTLFELDEIEVANLDTSDEKISVKLDIGREFDLVGNPSLFKFGTLLSRRSKTGDEDLTVYEQGGATPAGQELLSAHTTSSPDYHLGRFGPGINVNSVWNLIPFLDGDVDVEGSAIADTDIDEDIDAAYAMVRTDIGELRIIGGFRFEQMDRTSQGFTYDDDTSDVTTTQFEADDDHLLPSFHLRYQLDDARILRFAWTNTLSRPTFEQISPGVYLEGDEAEAGNPQLKTLEASNVDLSIEHYFGRIGVASIGLFYKNIDQFIYQSILAGDIIGLAPDIEVDTFDNGESATLLGLEFNFSTQLTSLPAPWNGLLIAANATVIDSEATLKHEDGKRDIALPNQSDTTANLTLGYENRWLSLRLSGVYKSEYLVEVGDAAEPLEDVYEDEHFQIDFNAATHITDNLQVYLRGVNLTDEPYYTYQYKSRYNAQYEEYGRTFLLGLQYNL